jgi:hypothetical protein
MRRCTIAEKKPEELIKVEPLRALSPFEEMERLWSKEFLKEPFCLLPSSMWKKFGLPEWGKVVFFRMPSMRLDPVDMHFSYREAFRMPSPEAYETLPLGVLLGDATLFMRGDQVEAAWRLVDPILRNVTPVHEYEPNTWGLPEADRIIARDDSWYNPKPMEAIG